jgi:hypothetical protein
MREITVLAGKTKLALLTRFCTGRPGLGDGVADTDLSGANYMTWEGA